MNRRKFDTSEFWTWDCEPKTKIEIELCRHTLEEVKALAKEYEDKVRSRDYPDFIFTINDMINLLIEQRYFE